MADSKGLVMTLGQRIRELRKSYHLTLKQCGVIAGLSWSYLSDLERSRTEPSLATLVKLADTFDMRVVELLEPVDLGEKADVYRISEGV